MKFAAFVMTYKRPEALEDTISKLFAQTLPPQKVLIVDNDPEKSAENILPKFFGMPVSYFSVGYNSGPAGAAYYGLKILAEEGWDWIGWIDDDNPPVFEDTFELSLRLGDSNSKYGVVGSVGQRFNQSTGLIERVSDKELEGAGHIEVDNIAGGMSKLVRSQVISKHGILPDEKLFFGFEELDFDIRVKRAGFLLACDKPHYLKHRNTFNRIGLKKGKDSKKSQYKLLREYYSIRNVLFILHKNKFNRALVNIFIRTILKSLKGFSYGIHYGLQNSKNIWLAWFDFLFGRMGQRKSLISKS